MYNINVHVQNCTKMAAKEVANSYQGGAGTDIATVQVSKQKD